MRYNVIKDASNKINRSPYMITSPERSKNQWANVFGNKNPIYIELGMGRGDFIIAMAQEYPNINFVGLEINDSQMVMATDNLRRLKLPNLRLINADAGRLDSIFGKEIDTIYITFPDPWPKKIDEKKRFTHLNYLKLYDKIFKNDKKHIIIKTDNKVFFAYSLESLSKYWYVFNKVSLDLHHDENPIKNIMTNFEKQYYKENRPIYYLDAKFPG